MDLTVFLRFVSPISKLISKIHAPFSHKKICANDYHKIMELMEPGDILTSRTCGELGNLFIPGPRKHAAIISCDGRVIEATTKGVIVTDLFDFMKAKDYVWLNRPNLPKEVREHAAMFARKVVGAQYDYEFESRDKEFYCSELVNSSYGRTLVDKPGQILPTDFAYLPMLYSNCTQTGGKT